MEIELGKRAWTVIYIVDCPKQANQYDCGLYAIYNFETFVLNQSLKKPTLTRQDILEIRGSTLSYFYAFREKVLKLQGGKEEDKLTDYGDLSWDTNSRISAIENIDLTIKRIKVNFCERLPSNINFGEASEDQDNDAIEGKLTKVIIYIFKTAIFSLFVCLC